MTYKRTPTDDEIEALAQQFRPLWRTGEAVRPWLRKHAMMLIDLVHDDWSWAGVATALDRAGVAYKTGNPWQAEQLRAKIADAQRPLKHTTTVIERNFDQVPDARAQDGRFLSPPTNLIDLRLPASGQGPEANQHNPSSKLSHVAESRFKPVVAKPYEPPLQLTSEESVTIEENRKRILGY